MTAEEANYIISHYSDLLNLNEKQALKHHRSSLKLQDMPDGELEDNSICAITGLQMIRKY
jgi:hypothetical protein